MWTDESAAALLRKHLTLWPLYKPDHEVYAHVSEGDLRTASKRFGAQH